MYKSFPACLGIEPDLIGVVRTGNHWKAGKSLWCHVSATFWKYTLLKKKAFKEEVSCWKHSTTKPAEWGAKGRFWLLGTADHCAQQWSSSGENSCIADCQSPALQEPAAMHTGTGKENSFFLQCLSRSSCCESLMLYQLAKKKNI